jgi:hypothetical protein
MNHFVWYNTVMNHEGLKKPPIKSLEFIEKRGARVHQEDAQSLFLQLFRTQNMYNDICEGRITLHQARYHSPETVHEVIRRARRSIAKIVWEIRHDLQEAAQEPDIEQEDFSLA